MSKFKQKTPIFNILGKNCFILVLTQPLININAVQTLLTHIQFKSSFVSHIKNHLLISFIGKDSTIFQTPRYLPTDPCSWTCSLFCKAPCKILSGLSLLCSLTNAIFCESSCQRPSINSPSRKILSPLNSSSALYKICLAPEFLQAPRPSASEDYLK